MTNTRITIELTPAELRIFDAWVAFRNKGIVGRPVTRASEARRILTEEVRGIERDAPEFWARTGKGASNRTESGNGG